VSTDSTTPAGDATCARSAPRGEIVRFAAMAEQRAFVLARPNREKAASRSTRAVVILLLAVTAALVAVVTIGGWSALAGMQAVQIAYIVVYVVIAVYVARWNRGVLPVAAGLALVLGILAAIAGPTWFERDHAGFSTPQTPFGGTGLDEPLLGLATMLIVPVQALLIAFAMRGFGQNWHVEVELPADEATPAPA